MKKLFFLFLLTILLTSCGTTEPTIPDDATVAECIQGDTFKYIYKADVVYEFYSNNDLQDQSMLDIVQTAVDNAGTASAYLDATFMEGVCTYTDYVSEKE